MPHAVPAGVTAAPPPASSRPLAGAPGASARDAQPGAGLPASERSPHIRLSQQARLASRMPQAPPQAPPFPSRPSPPTHSTPFPSATGMQGAGAVAGFGAWPPGAGLTTLEQTLEQHSQQQQQAAAQQAELHRMYLQQQMQFQKLQEHLQRGPHSGPHGKAPLGTQAHSAAHKVLEQLPGQHQPGTLSSGVGSRDARPGPAQQPRLQHGSSPPLGSAPGPPPPSGPSQGAADGSGRGMGGTGAGPLAGQQPTAEQLGLLQRLQRASLAQQAQAAQQGQRLPPPGSVPLPFLNRQREHHDTHSQQR